MATVTRVCRKCGAKVFSDAPEGLCTGCVLETALDIFPDAVAGVDLTTVAACSADAAAKAGSAKADDCGPAKSVEAKMNKPK